MNNFGTKTGTYVGWTILLVIFVAIYAVGFWYVKTQNEKASYELSSAEVADSQRDTIRNVERTLEELAPEKEKIDSYFVGADDVVSFINLLEEKAREQGVSIQTQNVVIPESEEEEIYGEELEVALTATGNWNNVMQYIYLLEGMPYRLWVKNVHIALEKSEEGVGMDAEEEQTSTFYWKADIVLRVLKQT